MGKTYQSITVNAPVAEVWAVVRNFHDLSWAGGIIETCKAVGDVPGTSVGARRLLNGVFHETLRAIDERERTLSYTIDDGPSPVSKNEVKDYVGTLTVYPITEEKRTFIEWKSKWQGNDEKAAAFCGPIYVDLLGALKRHFG